jgi:hypothetical protein
MQTHQNGSKIRPHAALHVSLFPGYQSAGHYSPAALMTAVGSLLGSCSCSLAARRLVLLIAPTRERGGRPVAAQGRREREGSISALP